jgi:hypothetical protein
MGMKFAPKKSDHGMKFPENSVVSWRPATGARRPFAAVGWLVSPVW